MSVTNRKVSPNGQDALVALILALLSLGFLLFVSQGRVFFGPDGARALHVAQNLASGEGLATKFIGAGTTTGPRPQPDVTKPPLFPIAVASLIKLGVEPKHSGWFVVLGAFSASTALLFLLARTALGTPLAVLVAALFTVQISSVRWGITIHEEALFVALSWASLWLFVRLRGGPGSASAWTWIGLGALVAAAVLASYQGAVLPFAIGTVLLVDIVRRRLGWRCLFAFAFGVAITGLVPFLRFVMLGQQGIRPGFDAGSSPTWWPIAAGMGSAFQSNFVGRIVVWLYDGSALDVAVVLVVTIMLVMLLAGMAKDKVLIPVAVYVTCYLIVLYLQFAAHGRPGYEARFSMPVDGLLLLAMAGVLSRNFEHRAQIARRAILAVGIAGISIFLHGQFLRFQEVRAHYAVAAEICPAPETIAWVRHNIPAGAVIFGVQCTLQLMAETVDYFLIPIPPAMDTDTAERWSQDDLLRIGRKLDAKWIVLPTGARGDPFAVRPGYGPFVADLLAGRPPSGPIEQVARLSDGSVYRIR